MVQGIFVFDVASFSGPSQFRRVRRRFEALGGPPLLPARQPEVEGPPGAPEPGLLLRRGRDTPQVRPGRRSWSGRPAVSLTAVA